MASEASISLRVGLSRIGDHWIEIALATFISLLAFFTYKGVTIAWLALPLAAMVVLFQKLA